MEIRSAAARDRDAVERFLARIPEGDRTFFKEDVTDPDVVAVWSRAGAIAAVAVEDGEVVGYVAVIPLQGWSSHVGEVRVIVDPGQRGRGDRACARAARRPLGVRARPAQAGGRGRRRSRADDRDVPLARLRSRGAARGPRPRPGRRVARPDDPRPLGRGVVGVAAVDGYRRGTYRLDNPHERLAGRVAAHHPRERLGRGLEPLDDRLPPYEAALAEQRAQLPLHLVEQVDVAVPRKPRIVRSFATREEEVARARRRLVGVVLGDRPAERDAAAPPQRAERSLEVVAADVVEVDVDAVGRRLRAAAPAPGPLVVERRVERRARRAGSAPSRPSRRCRSRGGRGAWRAARRGCPTAPAAAETQTTSPSRSSATREEPGVGGEPVPAEHAEVRLRRGGRHVERRQRADAAQRLLARPSTTA